MKIASTLATTEQDIGDFPRFAEAFLTLVENVETVIQGKREVVSLALIAMLSEGHLLIEDVPGVGKTMLAKAIAKSTSCTWRRIQFTPDLLPSDITGVSVYDSRAREFTFKPGAVFANIVLGDEINRASPKTQSALLEAMEEHQVTIDGVTHPLDVPFMVMATQNPIEHEGTYPLPESQLDRFMMKITVGYPASDQSLEILNSHGVDEPVDELDAVLGLEDLRLMIRITKSVHVAESIKKYIVALVEATREHPGVVLGASPRASLMLLRSARAKAASEARDFVIPDDVRDLCQPVLAHRLIVGSDARLRGSDQAHLVEEVVKKVSTPHTAVRS